MLKNQAALGIARVEQGARELLIEYNKSNLPLSGFYACTDVLTEQAYAIYRQHIVMTNSIPPRFSLKAFERIAPLIGQALDAYPTPITIHTKLSPRTMARCIQEALTAKRKFGYKHAAINESLWLAHGNTLGTAESGNALLLGDKARLRKPSDPVAGSAGSVPEIEVSNLKAALLDLAFLISHKHILSNVRFYTLDPEEDDVTHIEFTYDITFTPDETNPSKHYIT